MRVVWRWFLPSLTATAHLRCLLAHPVRDLFAFELASGLPSGLPLFLVAASAGERLCSPAQPIGTIGKPILFVCAAVCVPGLSGTLLFEAALRLRELLRLHLQLAQRLRLLLATGGGLLRVTQPVGRATAPLAGRLRIVATHLSARCAHVVGGVAKALGLLGLAAALLALKVARELLGLLAQFFLFAREAFELPAPFLFRQLLLRKAPLLAREIVLPLRQLLDAFLHLAFAFLRLVAR